MVWRGALLTSFGLAACTPASLTPPDLFFNEAFIVARTEAMPDCPVSCVDADGDGKCQPDELTSEAKVGGTWSFGSCTVKAVATGGSTPPACTQTRFRVGQRDQLVNWRDVAGPDGGTPVAVENGSSGFVIDSPMGFVTMVFPQLADGSSCGGLTALTVNPSTGKACLLEVATQSAGGGCTPRAKWVSSQGTMSFTSGDL